MHRSEYTRILANFQLAKRLEEKFNPLSANDYTVDKIFYVDEIHRTTQININPWIIIVI